MRILIVDDDKLVCSSLITILEAQGQTIAGIGCSGREALQLYRETNPDVLLMDIRMEGMNGVDASEAILHSFPDARILFLTTFSDDDYIIRALKLGVKGYILKQNFDSIIPALEAVYMGQNVFNTEIIAKLPDLLKQHTKETLCSYDLKGQSATISAACWKSCSCVTVPSLRFSITRTCSQKKHNMPLTAVLNNLFITGCHQKKQEIRKNQLHWLIRM